MCVWQQLVSTAWLQVHRQVIGNHGFMDEQTNLAEAIRQASQVLADLATAIRDNTQAIRNSAGRAQPTVRPKTKRESRGLGLETEMQRLFESAHAPQPASSEFDFEI